MHIAWAASPLDGRWPERADDLAKSWGYVRRGRFGSGEMGTTMIRRLIVAEIAARQAGPLMRHRRDLGCADCQCDAANEKGTMIEKLAFEMLGDYKAEAHSECEWGIKSANVEATIERIYGEPSGTG